MNTILTDDEIATAIAHLYAGPEVLAMALPDELRSARAVEAAVLAKLAQQEPAYWTRQRFGCEREFCEKPFTTGWTPLYAHPAPQQAGRHALQAKGKHPSPCARFCESKAYEIEIRQLKSQLEQADRQRVPEGYVLVPVEPTDEMVDAACDKSDFFRVDFALAWDAAINASPELTQSATSHTHKVVPVTPTKEMLISGARAPVELLSPDGALQVYRAMLAAAPEAPATAVVQVPQAVAYLDVGAGGYLDLGSDLTDEQLQELPKGRHMLAIVGTFGVDGYTPEAPTQAEFVHDPACKMCEGRGYYVAGYSGREDDGNAPIHEECDCWIPIHEAPPQASAVDERAAFEAWVARVKPTYWRAEAWQTEAWAMWQSISAALAQKGGAA